MVPRDTDHTLDNAMPGWAGWLWQTPWLWMALVVVLFCVPMFIGLDRQDLDNDEAIYSFGVEVMLTDGDWLTPKSIPSETSPFLEKPPLKFWITALPIHFGLLPQNEFGLRFMDALMSSLAFLYVFAIGRRLAGPASGLAAVLLLFTHGQLLFHHGLRSNNMEASMVLAYCGGVYHFLAWRSPNPDVKRHVFAMASYFVLGFMTKFVAVLFLPVILGAAALLTRADRGRLYRDWRTFALATVLATALIVPWFVYQFSVRGSSVFDVMVGAHVIKRFTATLIPAHVRPWDFYFTEIWAELRAAGTIMLVIAGAMLIVLRVVGRRWIDGVVIVLWGVVPLVLISAGTSKLYHYAYPFLPPVALAGGYAVAIGAKWLFRWLAEPINAAVRWRDRWLPSLARSGAAQTGATMAGLALLALAAVTFAFDRLRLAIGDVVLRNSSVARPAMAGIGLMIIGAPATALRGLAAGGLLVAVLPLAAYQANVRETGSSQRTVRDLRDCLAPIVAEGVARGQTPPGVWVEVQVMSYIPFYYLRGLGPWEQRSVPSDGTVLKHLLAPPYLRPVILSNERYAGLKAHLANDRADALHRASITAEIDPAVLEASAQDTIIGLVNFPTEVLLLPGRFSVCAPERGRLGAR